MPQGLQRPPSAYPGNNAMANGVVGQPGQSMQGQTSMNFVSVGPAPGQANGIQGGPSQQQGGPPPSGVQAPGMPFNTMMPGNQRPPPNGLAPSQQPQPGARGPNPNGGPFQSPTMAHSPQNNAGGPSQQHQPGPGQQQAPMAQLGPSPHMAPMNMNRGSVVGGHGMLPPNGGPPPSMGPPTPQGGGPPTPGYAPGNQGGRPPSRTNTPRSGMMTHPSPSMGARQTPGGGGPGGPQGSGMGGMMGLSQGGMGMMGMPGMTGMQSMGGPSGMSGMPMDGSGLNHEIMQIPLMNLNSIKQELGYGTKELGALDIQEKVGIQISSHFVLQSWLYLSLGFPLFFLLSSDLVDVACYIGKEEDWEQEANDQKAGEWSKQLMSYMCYSLIIPIRFFFLCVAYDHRLLLSALDRLCLRLVCSLSLLFDQIFLFLPCA